MATTKDVATTKDWLQINLGIDPKATPPVKAFKLPGGPSKLEDFQREIIEFDSEGAEGAAFHAFAAASTGLSKFQNIPWPAGKAPRPAKKIARTPTDPLPRADVLVVTWTVDEAHALSRVLTPGFDSRNDWKPYKHNWSTLSQFFRPGCPARNAGRLGSYWVTNIAGKKVVCFKSESHMSQDGPQLPNYRVWQQIVDEVKPALIITTGTGGGIGKRWEVGDVVVSRIVRFDCIKKFKNAMLPPAPAPGEPAVKRDKIAKAVYKATVAVDRSNFKKARQLFRANASQLPNTNSRKIPAITVSGSPRTSIVTTDFFGFDNVENTFKLKDLGDLSEMGDAVLGALMSTRRNKAPAWVAVRNVSDPQINEPGKSISEQAHDAALIYKGFGRWSSVCSAIVCWALIIS